MFCTHNGAHNATTKITKKNGMAKKISNPAHKRGRTTPLSRPAAAAYSTSRINAAKSNSEHQHQAPRI